MSSLSVQPLLAFNNMDNECSIDDKLDRILQDERAEPCSIPLQYLRDITANFSADRELGNGGFGVVYKGELLNGKKVAVKNLRSIPQCHEPQFQKELENLMKVRHKNIVRFVGYCCETQKLYEKFNGKNILAESTKMLLCFEYMPSGSLQRYISDEMGGLEWNRRYKIIKGICNGLHYLHDECQADGSIIHLDLKPENVLLDENFVPKISDFGLAKLFDHEKTQTSMTLFAGSLGYMSPEYIYNSIVSPMSDVYSLGVIIMQMVTGNKHGPSGTEEFCEDFIEPVLQNWRKRLETTPKDMLSTQENMSIQTAYEQIGRCLEIGINCIQYDRRKRPTIGQIVNMFDKFEGIHSNVADEGRPHANQIVQRYRERIYGADSTLRTDDIIYMDLNILERTVDGKEKPRDLNLPLLELITDNFSDKLTISTGGCAVIYKGILPNGIIAVKKLFNSRTIEDKMFAQEVKCMMNVEHQNIVRLLGYCSHTKEQVVHFEAEIRERLLCLEYISDESLDNHITDELRGLEWHKRYQIIKGICEGLFYLHEKKHIIHMDIKPANILLDDHMVPKIIDFGLSTFDDESLDVTADRLLSLGYCAPEYLYHGNISMKLDIYSLGVVILELVTGSKHSPTVAKVLRRWNHRWIKSAKGTLLGYQQVAKSIDLAIRCMRRDPTERPSIGNVISELNEVDSLYSNMLGIEPLELYVPFVLMKSISRSIKLTNDTDNFFAFRITTTSLLPYDVQPDKGIVSPSSKCNVTITLQELNRAPLNYNNRKDEFRVQSTRVSESMSVTDITNDMFHKDSNETDEVDFYIVLTIP